MLKKFQIQLPLGIEESYDLVRRSGDEIVSWRANNVIPDNHYLEWKQSFWAITGTTLITATLEETSENQTTVEVMVHKPIQVFDPMGICYRIFRKLEKAVQKNFDQPERED